MRPCQIRAIAGRAVEAWVAPWYRRRGRAWGEEERLEWLGVAFAGALGTARRAPLIAVAGKRRRKRVANERYVYLAAVRALRRELYPESSVVGRVKAVMEPLGERVQGRALGLRPAGRTLEQVEAEEFAAVRLARLTARQRRVVELHLGLDGGAALSFDELGRMLGRRRETMRQLFLRAVGKMAE